MSTARNQHYVPQRYLKRFTEDGSRIFGFDKETGQSFGPTNVRNVASEKGFFDVLLESVDDNPQMAEDKLSHLEKLADGWTRKFLAAVENRDCFDPNRPYLKEALGLVVAFQFLRTREFREKVQRAATELSSASRQDREECLFVIVIALLTWGTAIVQRRKGQLEWKGLTSPSGCPSVEHGKVLFDGGGFRFTRCAAEILKEHIWLVGDNQTGQPLYTSDAPVILCPLDEQHASGGLGLGSDGVEVAFPLSSRYILVLRERSYSAQEQIHEGKVLRLRPEGVSRYNALQVWTSYRQIYCAQDKFDVARETIKRSPILSQIGRPRFNISGDKMPEM